MGLCLYLKKRNKKSSKYALQFQKLFSGTWHGWDRSNSSSDDGKAASESWSHCCRWSWFYSTKQYKYLYIFFHFLPRLQLRMCLWPAIGALFVFYNLIHKIIFNKFMSPRGFNPRSLRTVGYEADATTVRPRRPTTVKKFL